MVVIVISHLLYNFQLGLNDQTKIMFLEVYVGAMLDDMNNIEILRAETPPDTQKLDKELRRLSRRELRMADFFESHPITSREFCLTAFSLNPTAELFDRLFPKSSTASSTTSASVVPQANQTETSTETLSSMSQDSGMMLSVPEDPKLITPKQEYSTPTSMEINDDTCDNNTNEDLGLPRELHHDILTLLFQPRWTAVGRVTKGEEQKRLCSQLLDKGLDVFLKEKNLEYVNVDYEKYKHLPSKYDPNDDGIEKGYGPREISKYGMNGIRRILIKKRAAVRQNNLIRRDNRGWPKGVPRGRNPNVKLGRPKGRVANSAKVGEIPQPITQADKKGTQGRELTAKLEKLQQFMYQNQSLAEFLKEKEKDPNFKRKPISHYGKTKKLKEQYNKAFLQPKTSLPGQFEIVPAPKAFEHPTEHEVNRQTPTGYVCKDLPYHLKIYGVGDFEIEFRVERHRMVDSFFLNPVKTSHPKVPIDDGVGLPKTLEEHWVDAGKEWNISLSAPSVDSKCIPSVAKVLLKQDPIISAELKQSTSQYLSLKQEAMMAKLGTIPGGDYNTPQIPTKMWTVVTPDSLNSPKTTQDETPVETNDANYELALGEIWQWEVRQKKISLPPMPKRKQDEEMMMMMVDEATERMRNNLKLETYRWDSVIQKTIKGM